MVLEFVADNKKIFSMSGKTAIEAYDILSNEPLVLVEKRRYREHGVVYVFFVNQTIRINITNDIDFYFKEKDFIIVKP